MSANCSWFEFVQSRASGRWLRPWLALMLFSLALPALGQTTTTISTVSDWNGSSTAYSFGFPQGVAHDTYGQTFTVPSGLPWISDINFRVGYNFGQGFSFTGVLMAWDGTEATGEVLFQSAPVTVDSSTVGLAVYDFPITNVSLIPGNQYVFFLLAIPGGGGAAAAQFAVTGDSSSYTGGNFVFTDSGGLFGPNLTVPWLQPDTASVYGDAVFSATFNTLDPAATPTFSEPAGIYTSTQMVTISDTTPNATIYYTTDGSTPTTSSLLNCSSPCGPITVSSTETINAIAAASGFNYSAEATAAYTILPPPPPPLGREWTWIAGSSTVGSGGGQAGVYGTEYTPAAADVPGGREAASSWTDSSGNLWLFGGYGVDAAGNQGFLNELWEFNPSVLNPVTDTYSEWAWMGGSSTVPASFEGQPGAYGSLGTPAAGNIPGGRDGAASWTDSSGRLWLFGGNGYDALGSQGDLNDLWVFNPSLGTNGEWAWMSGSETIGGNGGQSGVYGTSPGTFAAGIFPGGRGGASSWTDSSGNLWLFGGYGYDAAGNEGDLNDLWEFNPSLGTNGEWAWMGGSSTLTCEGVAGCWQIGVYGTQYVFAATNFPGSRWGAASWTDSSGNLWLFGGQGYDDGTTGGGWLSDLWEFNPSLGAHGEWAWMGGGSGTINSPGVYPAQAGAPAAGGLTPGGRYAASHWTDSSGNFWLLGGNGWAANDSLGDLNDLWEFNPSLGAHGEWAWMGGSSSTNQSGTYGAQAPPASGGAPGGRSLATGWIDSSGNFWLFGGGGYDAIGSNGYLNDLWEYPPSTAALPAAATPTFSVASGTYSSAQTVTISDTTPNNTIYYTTDGSAPGITGTTPNADTTTCSSNPCGPITVSSTETLEAIATASGYSTSAVAAAVYTITITMPQVATPTFSPGAGTISSGQMVTISDTTSSAAILYTTDGTTPTFTGNGLSPIPGAGTTRYSGPITVSSAETIEAIATAFNYTPSTVAIAAYTITQVPPPAGQWTWIAGSSTEGSGQGQSGVYGTIYTPATGNIPGGRNAASTWTDTSGNLWLFGGYGIAGNANYGYLNDMWVFNPSTMKWAWMGGSETLSGDYGSAPAVYGSLYTPAAGNVPGGRESASSWVDKSGNLWLFGGQGEGAGANCTGGAFGYLNDMWEFNPAASESSTDQWAFMGGSCTTNPSGVYPAQAGMPAASGLTPGGRYAAASWTDSSGNLWLFGGQGYDANGNFGELNDLWEFDLATKLWAWMGGSNTIPAYQGQPGVYGTMGTPAAGNIPGGRYGAFSWTDSSGNFWLYGGDGFDALGNSVYLNDLWEFNPSTKQWAWVGGSSALTSYYGAWPAVYGTEGTPEAENLPGGRYEGAGWTDSSGNLWVFGGDGYGASTGYLNDLWEFNSPTSQWVWQSGSGTPFQSGVYGAQTAPATGTPGSRIQPASWTDASGNLWLFGGSGRDANGNQGELNDLWEYPPPTVSFGGTAAATPQFSVASGTYSTAQNVSITDATAGATIYYTITAYSSPPTEPTTPNLNSNSCTNPCGPIAVSSTEVLEAIATAPGDSTSAVTTAAYTIVPQAATPTFSPGAEALSSPQPVTISDTPGAQIFYTTNGSAPTFTGTLALMPGPNTTECSSPCTITVTPGETVEAEATAYGYSTSAVAIAVYTASLLPAQVTDTEIITVTDTETFPNVADAETIKVTDVDSVGAYNAFAIAPSAASFNASSGTGYVTYAYAPVTFTATGGDGTALTLSESGTLPPGLTFNNGVLSGTPTAYSVASFPFSITVSDADGDSLTVPGYMLTIQPASAFPASVTDDETITVTDTETFPDVNDAETIRVTDTDTVRAYFAIAISPTSASFNASAPATGITGQAYGPVTFTATGGTGTLTLKESGTLPPGATYSNGVLSGTLSSSSAGTYPFSITATDAYGDTATQSGYTLTVKSQTTPAIAWATPAAITYGTALSATQLDATATVAGTFAYSPAAGTVPGAGTQTLSVTFTPTDTTDYATATATVQLTVNQAAPAITWATPAAITYGTALSGAQLDATATVAGTFAYSPPAGTVPGAGTQTLSVTFTPADTTDYATATATVQLSVNNPVGIINSLSPAVASSGGAAFTLTVNGSGFVSSSTVYWGTTSLTTTYVSPTQLTAQVTAADTASAGITNVTVESPAPVGVLPTHFNSKWILPHPELPRLPQSQRPWLPARRRPIR